MKILFFIKRSRLAVLLLFLFGFTGCFEDKFDLEKLSTRMEVNPSFTAPIAKGSLTIEDLVSEDGENIVYDSSDAQGPFLKFIYREDSIFSFGGNDFFSIHESDSDGYSLGNIELEQFGPVEKAITLRQIVKNATTNTTEAQTIKNADGTSVPFPTIDSLAISGDYKADAIDHFRYAWFEQGMIEVTLTNNMPVKTTAQFQLRTQIMDASGSSVEEDLVLKRFVFEDIPAGGNLTKTFNLAGEKLGSVLYATEIAMSSPGTSSSVEIKLDEQNLHMEAQSTDLVISSGEISILNQVLDAQQTKVSVGNTGDRRLDTVRLKGGTLNYSIQNNTNIPAIINITLPNSEDLTTGDPVAINTDIPAQSTINQVFDLTDTQTSLNGLDSLPIEYTIELGGTQNFVSYNASDRVDFNYSVDISSDDADYISGYFGQDTIQFPSDRFETGLDLFSNFTGDFTLTNPSIRLFYQNSIGVPFAANLNLVAESEDGTRQNLNEGGSQGILEFGHPTSPEQTLNDTLVIDKSTSDLEKFISLPPGKILFDGEGYINHNTTPDQRNFITSQTDVQVGMEMDLPLDIKTAGLTYRDSVPFELEVEFDESLRLFGKFTNELPFTIDLQLICRDSTTNEELLSLQALDSDGNPAELIKAPEIGSSGRVSSPGENLVYFMIEGSELEKFNQTNQLVIIATVATPGTEGVRFYSDYSLDFRIGIDETGTNIAF